MAKVEVEDIKVKFICMECDNVEDVPLKVLLAGAVITCSDCGNTIVETERTS